ncbi:unnamed protein product [Trichogramma brassicae]|uniref:Reverse transcriptase domain-containing protein n=1 Tax=Trichogramma brassicae TaxID=86971 RepID=A0A6H5J1A2_9HYME|nr:unnamed protein product [Trichogramma brassicae]
MDPLSSSSLKILFWNSRSIQSKLLELRKEALGCDIIACVETWLKPGTRLELPGFHSYRCDRVSRRCGGVAIWVRNSLVSAKLNAKSTHDSVESYGIRILNTTPALDIIVIYRSPDTPFVQEEWNRLLNVAEPNHATIFMGDFNAHHTSWNCEYCDGSGLRLESAYKLNSLFLHNFGTSTFVDLRRNYASNLDLVFSSQNIKDIVSTSTNEDLWGSDHRPVFVNITLRKHLHIKKGTKFTQFAPTGLKSDYLLKTDMRSFCAATMTVLMLTASTTDSWRQSQRSYASTHRSQIASPEENTPIQPHGNATTDSLKRNDASQALDKLCPPWTETNPDEMPEEAPDNPFLDELFSFHEFNAALADKRDSSAPGMDGIGFDAIKKLSLKYKLLLLDIYNEMYSRATFPDSWREAFVIFISKASGSGLRPISLTSCFCKLFETLVRNKLQWWAETHNWLPRSQHGFRKGFSCSDNLSGLLLRAEEALSTGREVSTAFLDVEGAFDNVNIDILIDSLARLGCSSCPLKFIKFITHERIIHTTNNDTTRRSYKGVPQGSVLSPLLYSIYVASIIKDLPARVYVSQFADDLAVYTISGDSTCSISTLEDSVKIIDHNLNKLGLNIAPHKTKFIHINNKKIEPGSKAIRVRDSTIKSGNNYKFLGITFDYELSFKAHVNHIHTRCSSAMNMIRFLRGTWWGSHPETLTTMYKCYIHSILDYACYIYFPSISTLQLKLERIQYAAIRLCLGYRQSTPTNILLAETKLPSLHLAESFRRDCFTTSITKCEADGLHKGKIYFNLFHRHNKSTPWFTGKNLPRSMIVTINRIRSNHHSLAESLHRKNITDDPGCACGSEEESLNHVLWNCGRYERQRRPLWKELARLGLSAPLNAESIVAKPNLPACLALHRFLQNCNLQRARGRTRRRGWPTATTRPQSVDGVGSLVAWTREPPADAKDALRAHKRVERRQRSLQRNRLVFQKNLALALTIGKDPDSEMTFLSSIGDRQLQRKGDRKRWSYSYSADQQRESVFVGDIATYTNHVGGLIR